MRFKKRLISEEIGLNNPNKKTFTKGKTQKIVMSEDQLQRLMVSLKDTEPKSLKEGNEGMFPDWFKDFENPCPNPPCEPGGQITGGGEGDCEAPDWWDPISAHCYDGGSKSKREMREGWLEDKARREVPQYPWEASAPTARELEMREGPNPASAICGGCQNSPQGCISCQTGYAQAPSTHQTQPCECVRASSLQKKKPSISRPEDAPKGRTVDDNSNGGSGVLPICCYRPNGTVLAQNCNNCTRPGFYCANCPPPLSESLIKNNLKEMRKLRTTEPINESQVDKMSGWFDRLNKTGTHYNPDNLLEDDEKYVSLEEDNATWKCEKGKCVKVCGKCGVGEFESEQECEDSNCEERARPGGYGGRGDSMSDLDTQALMEIKHTYALIRKAIIKENIKSLNLRDYKGSLLSEQGQYDRNPGIAAAEGIEVIIDNLKKGWAMIKDSTTKKQIQNTLTKLNNFMMYSAELVGSGSSQRAPRSYDELSNPLPYPELDEPEDLEDIDDGLGDFDEEWRNEEGKQYHNKNNR